MPALKFGCRSADAISMLADGELTVLAIAEQLGVHQRTIRRWSKMPRVLDIIEKHREKLMEKALEHSLAHPRGRVFAKIKRHKKLERIVQARAEKYRDDKNMAGGETGLLVKEPRKVGDEVIDVAKIDKSVLDSLSKLEKGIAEELGQRVDKLDVTSAGSAIGPAIHNTIVLDLSRAPLELLDKLQPLIEELERINSSALQLEVAKVS